MFSIYIHFTKQESTSFDQIVFNKQLLSLCIQKKQLKIKVNDDLNIKKPYHSPSISNRKTRSTTTIHRRTRHDQSTGCTASSELSQSTCEYLLHIGWKTSNSTYYKCSCKYLFGEDINDYRLIVQRYDDDEGVILNEHGLHVLRACSVEPQRISSITVTSRYGYFRVN